MTAQTNKKNSSIKKRLVPATAMLVASAMALASSTYAWFTMSREVEVTGIQMTASVPESLQISLGDGMLSTLGTGNDATTNKLAGTLTGTRLTAMKAPGADDADTDWTNSIAISDYYVLGHLTPATSANGQNIFYTGDSTVVGKTLATDATFSSATKEGTHYSAALALKTNGTGSLATDAYEKGGAYYVDIPVWFRTSSTTDVNLGVIATITRGTTENVAGSRASGSTYEEDIFKAARVAILMGDGTVSTTANGTDGSASGTVEAQGVIYSSTADTGTNLQSGYYRGTGATATTINATKLQGVAITSNATDGAFTWNSEGAISEISSVAVKKVTEAAADATNVGYTGDTVVKVPAVASASRTAGKNFGQPTRYTIRVWIDGEDVNCWNATAGQDFSIDLKFVNKAAATNPNA